MDDKLKEIIKKAFSDDKIKELVEKDKWDELIKYLLDSVLPHIDYEGPFIDFLINSGIDFIPYMKKVPSYAFYKSTLLKEADLRNCESVGSRAFRKSNIEKIYFSKDNLKDLDVGIISGVEHPVTIMWDGNYAEWLKIRKNSNCWYNYPSSVSIHCIDGIFPEDNTFR